MIKQLLGLTEQRLERLQRERSALRRMAAELQQQQQDLDARIQAMQMQLGLYDQAAEFTRDAFFERQRHKAALLAEIARLLYQMESLQQQRRELTEQQHQQQYRLNETYRRCEKFRSYLKRLAIKACLKSVQQQHDEIEELSTYGGDKNGV